MKREEGKAKKKKKKWSSCQLADVEEYHAIFWNTILTVSVFTCFWGEGLVQSVISPSSMREVSSSMPKCDLQSLFRLLSFPCIALSSCKYPWNGVLMKVLEGWWWGSGLVRRWSWLFRGADVKLRALTFYLSVGKKLLIKSWHWFHSIVNVDQEPITCADLVV